MYNCFILPILEYACEVWDGCTSQKSDILEGVQLEAARTITGLPLFCKRNIYTRKQDLKHYVSEGRNASLTCFIKCTID